MQKHKHQSFSTPRWSAFKRPPPLLPPHAPSLPSHCRRLRRSCLLNICHPPATLDYAIHCTASAQPVGNVWRCDLCAFQICCHALTNEIALICLPSPHMINKIHLNISLLPLLHMWGDKPGLINITLMLLMFLSLAATAAAVEDNVWFYILMSLGTPSMLMCPVISVFHGDTLQDVSSCPAVTTLSETNAISQKAGLETWDST